MTSLLAPSLIPAIGSVMGLVAGALFLVVVLGLVGVFVIVVVSNRAEPDPASRRPLAVFLFAASFVTVWTALIGAATVVASLVQLIGSHPEVRAVTSELHPVGDAAARGVVLGGLVFVASVVIASSHLRRGLAIATSTNPDSPASRRVGQSYVSAVAFIGVLVAAVAAIVVVYMVFQIAGPGVFSGGDRIVEVRKLIDAAFVSLAAGGIAHRHLHLPVTPHAMSMAPTS